MQYPAYSDYITSEDDWLGDLPSHWEKFALKRRFNIVNGSTPKSGESEFWGGDLIWVTPADFSKQKNGYLSVSERKITQAGLESCGTTLVKQNSIVLSTRAPIGEVVQAGEELCTNQGCKSLVSDSQIINERFYFYSLAVSSEQLNILGLGTTFMELSKDALGYYPVALPPIEEQQKIAAFLDYKTQQIDQLIEKKKALIEKLEEKRIAVIAQAVTKGLDKNAKLKPSGVDWLGDVPEHWGVRAIKFSFKDKAGAIKTGPFGSHIKSEDMTGSAYKVYNQKNVIQQDLSLGDEYIDEEKYEELISFEIFDDDLLVTTRGTIGKCIAVPEGSEKGILHPCLMRIQFKKDVFISDYFIWLLQESGLLFEELSLCSNATTLDVIYSETLKNVVAPLPPLDEQKNIVDYLVRETKPIAEMYTKVLDAIDRLNEYRSALITSAVTGKIDLREIKVPKEVA